MRCPLDGKVDQVCQGEFGSPDIEMATGELPAKDRGHLEVDQFWGCQVFTTKSRSGLVAIPTVVSECDGKDARVNDEHAQTGVPSPRP